MKLQALALVLVIACGKGGDSKSADSDKVASCNVPSVGSCIEYRGGNLALGTEHLAKICEGSSAKLELTPCPTADRTSSCAGNEGTHFYYKSSPITVDEYEKICKGREGSTFTRY